MNTIFSDIFFLETERLYLKMLDPVDAPIVLEYYKKNREFFEMALPCYHEDFFTEEYQTETLWQEFELFMQKRALRFYLFNKDDLKFSEILGDISISNIVWGTLGICSLGCNLSKEFTGKGFMTEAVTKVIMFLFEEFQLHRIEAYIQPNNSSSIKLIEKLGFEKEGLAVKYMFTNSGWQDHQRYALINEDFE